MLDAGLQGFERGEHASEIAGARAFFVGLIELNGIVAEIGDGVTDGFQAFNQACGAQRGGSAFVPGGHCGRAGGRAQQSNLVGLPDNLYRHAKAP